MKHPPFLVLGLALALASPTPATAQSSKVRPPAKAARAKAGAAEATPQDPVARNAKAEKKSPAQKDYDRLLVEVRAARNAHFKKLREDMQKRRAAGNAPKSMAIRMPGPPAEVLAGFYKAANKYAPTDDAIRFYVYLLGAEKDAKKLRGIVDTLLGDYMKSAALASAAAQLPRLQRSLGREAVAKTLQTIIDKSPHKSVQAAAYFARGNMVVSARGKVDDADKKRAHDDLRQAVKLDPRGAFASRAQGILYEADHLGIGHVAPNITGKDTDGVEFSLYDYKGKVIMLDFWGDW